jgi:hypothetical protein
LVDVDPSDGIDVDEARAIAWAYFEHEYGDCGGPGDVTRKKRTWVFKVKFGVAGDIVKQPIKVDVKTGGVRSQGGPHFRDFKSFRDRKDAPYYGDPESFRDRKEVSRVLDVRPRCEIRGHR